jgi:hypothetical protein
MESRLCDFMLPEKHRVSSGDGVLTVIDLIDVDVWTTPPQVYER